MTMNGWKLFFVFNRMSPFWKLSISFYFFVFIFKHSFLNVLQFTYCNSKTTGWLNQFAGGETLSQLSFEATTTKKSHYFLECCCDSK